MSIETAITLQTLPRDIHFCILERLDWQSIKAVRLTSRAFASLLPKEQLARHHTICAAHLYQEEIAIVRRKDAEYWEAAEQAFLGNTSNYHYSSLHDSDLIAAEQRWSSSHDILPCYMCLHWLPTLMSENKPAAETHFSRTRSTLAFDLGGKRARDRFCIACGIRSGIYPRGQFISIKQSIVCLNCAGLSDSDSTPDWYWLKGPDVWKAYFCRQCLGTDGMKLRYQQYRHELIHGKYHVGMKRRTQYRVENGKRLREQRGFQDEVGPVVNSFEDATQLEGAGQHRQDARSDHKGPSVCQDRSMRVCPIMKEMRFCHCSEGDMLG